MLSRVRCSVWGGLYGNSDLQPSTHVIEAPRRAPVPLVAPFEARL